MLICVFIVLLCKNIWTKENHENQQHYTFKILGRIFWSYCKYRVIFIIIQWQTHYCVHNHFVNVHFFLFIFYIYIIPYYILFRSLVSLDWKVTKGVVDVLEKTAVTVLISLICLISVKVSNDKLPTQDKWFTVFTSLIIVGCYDDSTYMSTLSEWWAE